MLDFGAWISFTGVASYRNAPDVQAAARLVPADRIMVETDAPFLSPEPHRKVRPCQPWMASVTAKAIAALRGELGKVPTPDIISGQRAQLMQRIKASLNASMASFGVDIIDVRIRRADLPPANSERVYERMKAELNQKAALYRAEGEEQYLSIVGDADKQVSVILAEANEASQKLRGEGDSLRNAIYASAYGKDPEFFSFYRSMQAYERSIKEGTPLVISPDSEFFRYFGDKDGR